MWILTVRQFLVLPKHNLYCTYKTVVPRVRFAPSPTGYLHLGGLRTALYNYLFTKSRNGVFILRIEDTDQTRKVEGSVDALIDDLEWAGIEYNEGPGRGQCGPYVQSKRLDIYEMNMPLWSSETLSDCKHNWMWIVFPLGGNDIFYISCSGKKPKHCVQPIYMKCFECRSKIEEQEYIQKLIDNGSAYKCFCTERRLNILRRDAMRHQKNPKYDNKCRGLSDADIKDKIKAGIPYCIRFKLSPDCQYFEDLIFGSIAYDVSLNEGDPVLMKSDGYPTYHFANVVDDYLMGITHVLRGVEWQISTTKHLLIYRAFGWEPPEFGHLPLIVNSDGTKLSKRQSDVKVDDYRQKGIYPLALVNYITLSGGGFDHVAGEGIRCKSMEQLTEEFQINKISSHPSKLNVDLLEECNRLEIKRQLSHDNLTQLLINKLQNLIKEKFPKENLNIESEHIKTVLEWATSRISRIEDLATPKFAFLWLLPCNKNIEINKHLFENLIDNLEQIDKFEEDLIKNNLKQFCLQNDIKYPVLMKILRSVLSGLNEGPSVAEMMQLLGKCQSLERIKAVVR